MTAHETHPPEVGMLGDEAAKLAEAVQFWATERLLPMAEEFGGSEECTVCPVCRLMALVRGERPEVMKHLSDAAGALAAAFAAAVAPEADEESSPGAVPEEAGDAEAATPPHAAAV